MYKILFYELTFAKSPLGAGGFIHFEVSACPFLRKTVPEIGCCGAC